MSYDFDKKIGGQWWATERLLDQIFPKKIANGGSGMWRSAVRL